MLKHKAANKYNCPVQQIQQNKQNVMLPTIKYGFKGTKFNQHKKNLSLDIRYSMFDNTKTENKGKNRQDGQQRMRVGSLREKCSIRENTNFCKMEKSILKFVQNDKYLRKIEIQKKKKLKLYSIQSFQDEQAQFVNNFKNNLALKQQQFQQQHFKRQFPLQTLPNICYDSQFSFQREGPCLSILNNKLYMFGGAIRRKFHYLPYGIEDKNVDVLFHSYDDDRWVRQPLLNQLNSDKKNLVYHTINAVHKKFILIAGGLCGDSQKTLSKFNKCLMLYNTQSNKLQQFPINFTLRSHASVAFDNYTILHGGISQQLKIKNDLHVVVVTNVNNIYTLKCYHFETNECLAHHQMVATLGEDKSFRVSLRENNGIYLFGGEDDQGKMNNQMKILKICSITEMDKKGCKYFEIIRTFGQPPCARKNHSMNLVSSKNVLVIIGGLDSQTNSLSDVWLFELTHMKWCKIQTQPSISIQFGSICKHSAVSNSSSVFIFGGKQLKDPGSSNFLRLDLSENIYEKKSRNKRSSQISKISSMWSISRRSSNQLGTSDKILLND